SDLYMVHPSSWRAEICGDFDASAVAKTLADAGWLERGDGRNITRKVRLPGVGPLRVYVIKPGLMATPADAPEEGE
ncbi:hypothetical protein RQ832_25965, partial [Roseomonas sp. DSM 102946]|nr:hypothetical protein [Roseomonas sp. DSM 102946]